MQSNRLKQRARERRERTYRRRIITLSWTLPVFAFGGFFSIWHSISAAVSPPIKAKPELPMVTKQVRDNVVPVAHTQALKGTTVARSAPTIPVAIYKIGSNGPQVSAIQEQLAELGYFNHAITQEYGDVTAHAVEAFQLAHHLQQTGGIDRATLIAIQQAVKSHHTSSLMSTSSTSAPSQNQQSSASQTPSSAAVSQQSTPQTSSSAS